MLEKDMGSAALFGFCRHSLAMKTLYGGSCLLLQVRLDDPWISWSAAPNIRLRRGAGMVNWSGLGTVIERWNCSGWMDAYGRLNKRVNAGEIVVPLATGVRYWLTLVRWISRDS